MYGVYIIKKKKRVGRKWNRSHVYVKNIVFYRVKESIYINGAFRCDDRWWFDKTLRNRDMRKAESVTWFANIYTALPERSTLFLCLTALSALSLGSDQYWLLLLRRNYSANIHSNRVLIYRIGLSYRSNNDKCSIIISPSGV